MLNQRPGLLKCSFWFETSQSIVLQWMVEVDFAKKLPLLQILATRKKSIQLESKSNLDAWPFLGSNYIQRTCSPAACSINLMLSCLKNTPCTYDVHRAPQISAGPWQRRVGELKDWLAINVLRELASAALASRVKQIASQQWRRDKTAEMYQTRRSFCL